MSILNQMQDINEEDNDQEIKQVNISATQLPLYFKDYRKNVGAINPKIVENIRKQFVQDPNTCPIKDLQVTNTNSDDSFNSNDAQELTDINQHTIKMRFLMDRYKIKEESYLGDALVKDSVSSYIYNMNKRTIISKQFKDQSESYRHERDALCNWSQFNLNKLSDNQLKKDKEYDFKEINKKYEKKELSNDESIFFQSTTNNTINSARDSTQAVTERKRTDIKSQQKEINLLNHVRFNDMFKKITHKEEKHKEFLEKFNLNKTFDFGIDKRTRHKSSHQLHKQGEERYQDEIFPKLPSDIDTIHRYLVEYIDVTGEGNLQPQKLIELQGDIYAALNLPENSNKQNVDVQYTKAVHSDYIETFSTVVEKDQKQDLNIMTFQREISPISRQVIKQLENVKLENQDEVELIKNNENEINLDDLKDEDLYNIISGRIDKDNLRKFVEQYEQYQNKILQKSNLSTTLPEDSKEQMSGAINQIRAKFMKKGTEDKDSQACFFNKDEHKFVLENNKKDPDSDNQSVSSHLTKSQISIDKGTKTPTVQSSRVSIIGGNNRKSQSQIPRKIDTPKRSANINLGLIPRNSLSRQSISNRSPSKQLDGRKNSNSISLFQQQYLQAFSRKGSQAIKNDREDIVSAYSFDSEIKEQQEDLDEDAQQKKEYLSMIGELDSMETEHNQLLKAILSVQLSPQIHPIYKEVKELRILKKYIMSSKDINEAIELTKGLNHQICSKLKQILMLVFDGETNFELGLQKLLANMSKINQKNNTIEQGKLKIVFALLQQFRSSLEENKFDVIAIQKQQDPEFQIQKIQEALDKYQDKKSSALQRKKEEKKVLDYSKLSFFNFRTKKESSPKDVDNQELNQSKTLKDSSSSSSLASSTVTTKTLTKEALNQRSRRPTNKSMYNNSKPMDVSFSKEKVKPEMSTPQIKIGLEQVGSQTSLLNTASNTHKSSSTTGKTFSFLKDKSTTSLNKSPSNLSQILSLSPLVPQQDSPFMGGHLEQIPELDLNSKSMLSLSSKKPTTQQPKQQTPSNGGHSNLWNQAKMNLLNSINANKQANNSTDKKKNVSFTWQNQIKLLKQQKEQQEKAAAQQIVEQGQQKIKQIKNVINNYEQVIQNGLSSARDKSVNRSNSKSQLQNTPSTNKNSESKMENTVFSMKRVDSTMFSPVNQQSFKSPSSQQQTPLRNKNSNSSTKIQSDSKLNNTSANLFEYMSKENGKSYMEKSRKDLYTRTQKSVERVSKHFNQFIVKTQEFMA